MYTTLETLLATGKIDVHLYMTLKDIKDNIQLQRTLDRLGIPARLSQNGKYGMPALF